MEPVTGRDVRVSVIVPVHGHDRYFDGCLRSVLERQDQDLELVLVDDASRSEEIERLLHRAEADPRCRVLRNRENVGISRTLNRGIAAATGTHFAFLDCDDELVEGALGRIVEVVRAEGTHYLSTQIEDIDHEGRVIDTRPREETPEDLMRGNFAGHLKVISRRVFERVGPFDPAVDGCQDYDLALRCAEVFPLRFLPDALYRYRWHTGTISVKREAEQEALAERVRRRARLRRFLADESVQKGGLFGIEVLLLGAEAVEPPLPRSFETRVTRIDGSWESGRDDLASLGEAERERLAAIGEAEGPPMVLLVAEGGSLDAADVVSLVARLSEEPGRRAVVPAPAGRLPSFVSGPGAVHAEGVLLERSVLTLLRDPAALRDVVENEAPCVEWGWGVEAQPVPERDPVRPLD